MNPLEGGNSAIMSNTNAAADNDGEIQSVAATMQSLEIDSIKSKNGHLSPSEKQNILLNHIILPRFLPQSNTPQFYQTELQLFDEMYENVMDLSEVLPSKTVALFKSMHKIHHKLTPTDVSNEINALQPGDTFAMFVRRQNCTFMVYVPPDENIANGRPQNSIVATFPGRLHPNEVYKCDSDIEFTYPQQAIKVKFSQMLCSEEFAYQLCFMYNSLPIESKNRNYVSKWLMAVLGDEHSHTPTTDDFPTITKKIRDELLGHTTKNYFRRSSFYAVIKVLLQHSLTMQMGTVFGEMMYKCVMLKFLIHVCGFYKHQATFDINLLSQMIAKMARRIEKLKFLFVEATDPYLIDMFDVTVREAVDLIAIIRMKIDEQINEHIALEVQLPALNGLNFTRDLEQKMPKLSQYLETREERLPKCNKEYEFKVNSYERFAAKKSDPTGDNLGIRLHWMEFEQSMLNGDIRWNSEAVEFIYDLSNAYSKYAEAAYVGNTLFISRMILVRLKIISLLDQFACEEFPLLLEHHSGIKPSIIAPLLLPQRTDMKLANELEQYFSERNENAHHPSLIGERHPTDRSFSAKFAKQDTYMKLVCDRILETDSHNLLRKEHEVIKGRQKCAELRNEAVAMECQFSYKSEEKIHLKSCVKCQLEKKANAIKVRPYEHLLPNEWFKQMAIVFELSIPAKIAYLRDTLFSFTKYFNYDGFDKKIYIYFKWTSNSRSDIKCHNRASSKYLVQLGNTLQHSMQSLHVDNTMDSFEIKNKRDCVFHYASGGSTIAIPTSYADGVIKDMCTFRTQNEYNCLQWTVYGTNHTQNQILTLQSKCPNELTLSEFKNFGSLRADGHRLQFRNLYAMIETEGLSFEKESVLSLIMQTLWQYGVKGDDDDDADDYIRESHVDFNDPVFCNEFIQLLKKFVVQQQCNWKHPLKIIMAILIAVRAFEINADALVADAIVGLLNDIRFVVLEWIDKINGLIHDMEDPDELTERELRFKLIYLGVAGALTFFIHPKHKHFERIFNVDSCSRLNDYEDGTVTAPTLWLLYIITVKNNTLMCTTDESSLPSHLRMFLRMVESIGVHLEASIKAMLQQNPTSISHLIQKLWTTADGATVSSCGFHSDPYPHIFIAKTELGCRTRTITIDIIAGIFLVDGHPVGRLRLEIVKSDGYRRFFGDLTFAVQPDALTNHSNHEIYSTVQRYNGCAYEIQMNGNEIIITERRTDSGVVKELIDHSIFSEDFPHLLVHNYSHWLNKSSQCIEFRRRTFGQVHFSKETTIDYELNLQTKRLCHTKTGRWMLDVCSDSYRKIIDQLTRLEHSNYIHIMIEKCNPDVAMVEVVRMNLKFKVDASKDQDQQQHLKIESYEFNGMEVSRQQNIGTLYGLNHGLLLESSGNAQNRILLIPHANVQCKRTKSHVTVDIATENELQHPPFFQYKIDEFCRQIKSNNRDYTSWFYLAYLHAITSHGQIEPFIGLSGTERSIQILQSAFAWSSAPYEAAAIEWLVKIAELTPRRRMDENRQVVSWPDHVQPHAAQDCFVFIAMKLLEDSQRLHGLYFKEKVDALQHIETDLYLNARDHRRCQSLNPNLCVSMQFIEHTNLFTSPPERYNDSFSPNTQAIAALYHRQQYVVREFLDLKVFLLSDIKLMGLSDEELNILNHATYDSFANLWIRLYDAARKRLFNPEQFALILSVYAHRGVNIDAILALQAIATHPNAFELIDPPLFNEYDTLHAMNVNNAMIYGIVTNCLTPPSSKKQTAATRLLLNSQIESIYNEIMALIHWSWPCDFVNLIERWYFPHVNLDDAKKYQNLQTQINAMLHIWNKNRQLYIFIDQVEQCLRLLPASGVDLKLPNYIRLNSSPLHWSKFNIDFDHVIHENLNGFAKICNDAKQKWLANESTECATATATADDWWLKIHRILNSTGTKHLIDAGIFPRMVPSLLLPKVLDRDVDERFKCVIGAWAIAIACEQWQKRIKSYDDRSDGLAAREQEILQNKPHNNWKPCERPEWLLFEIEQNLTIRRIQVEVANRMIDPPAVDSYAKHSVMQLNMGEGKTAVIVPILAAVLADGTRTCQITVLKSLFGSNLNSLRQYLGGMLNRRIYTFPCRRDMPIGQHISQVLDIYKECMLEKGVILTLPEYRLSLQLKMYEAIQKSEIITARAIFNVLKWSNQNIRNILDESDAILQPKYQLIYTVGNQLQADGAELRWTVAQAVFKRVPYHMKCLYDEYGKDYIEFGGPSTENRADKLVQFIPCRILNENMFESLKTKLIDDFLDGKMDIDFPDIIPSKREALQKVLMNKTIDSPASQVMGSFLSNEQNTILILSGLLRFEVLKLVLTKRWRVHYGINANGHRKMAVPFKAKDKPVDNSEFGHTDVAVCFTLLSYYYSGLSNIELVKVFNILDNDQNAKSIYGDWIRRIPKKFIDPTIRMYDGINLEDVSHRDTLLFPLLRYHMHVIDFYLSHVVFRHELKIFESKLVCTAWDLCNDHFEHIVTGFSGTNDTKDILPLPIAQNDLKKLENTNQKMRDILLQPENQAYLGLPARISGMEIIERLIKHDIPVLLDTGALLLELNNKEVAEEWLKRAATERFDAAVYFDSCDTLQTIDRNGTVTAFDCSVYRENLNRCLVYLDDVHTRGTDLKFPLNWRACVTVCGDLQRDKTVQSCMRMRQLGKTHSISFWASYEADTRIRNLCNLSPSDRVKNEHVVEFICDNSKRFERTNMSHWAAAALNYTKKLRAHKLFEASNNDRSAMNNLYRACVDNEFVKLSKIYGAKEEALITEISKAQFSMLSSNPMINSEIRPFIDAIQTNVNDKLSKKAPNLKQFTHSLDEEQEKELEFELEEQRLVERPSAAVAVQPQLDERFVNLVQNGVDQKIIDRMKKRGVLMSLAGSLSHTQLFRLVESDCEAWANHILVTRDFKTVTASSTPFGDEFLRPVWWIAQLKNLYGNDILMLMSPYECNQLLPAFRTSKMATLFPYRPRLSKFHNNLMHNRKLQITGINKPAQIDIKDEIQIAVYSGSMYFKGEAELNAYCEFLGVIPRPRSDALQKAFEQQIIQTNGFVPIQNRQHSPAIRDCVGQCKFRNNPIDLAVKLIEANHQNSTKFSHAASILIRGKKPIDVVLEDELSSFNEIEIIEQIHLDEHLEERLEEPAEEQLHKIDIKTAASSNCQIQ